MDLIADLTRDMDRDAKYAWMGLTLVDLAGIVPHEMFRSILTQERRKYGLHVVPVKKVVEKVPPVKARRPYAVKEAHGD